VPAWSTAVDLASVTYWDDLDDHAVVENLVAML